MCIRLPHRRWWLSRGSQSSFLEDRQEVKAALLKKTAPLGWAGTPAWVFYRVLGSSAFLYWSCRYSPHFFLLCLLAMSSGNRRSHFRVPSLNFPVYLYPAYFSSPLKRLKIECNTYKNFKVIPCRKRKRKSQNLWEITRLQVVKKSS